MRRLQSRLRDERGMTLVMVATGLVAFLSATMLAVDVGMLMVARTEAQSAADAGALAGAIALGYDDFDDRSATGPAVQNAIAAATAAENGVMNAQASVLPEDVTFPTIERIRVRVQRSGVRGNPLSTFIAPMFGIPTVDLGAVATAEVSPANAMTCVKPFTVPDKWIEMQTPPWDPDDTFDVFDNKGNPLANPDIYIPIGQPGYTGLQLYDRSRTAHHTEGRKRQQHRAELLFPLFDGRHHWCGRIRVEHWQLQLLDHGLRRSAPGRARQHDRSRRRTAWTPSSRAIRPRIGITTTSSHRCTQARASSRSRCSIPSYWDNGKQNGRNADLKVVNYMGFFIEEMQGNDVKGRITPIGGILTGNGGPAPTGAFPIAIVLVK